MTESPAYPFLWLIQQFQVATSGTSPDMKYKGAPAKSMHWSMVDTEQPPENETS